MLWLTYTYASREAPYSIQGLGERLWPVYLLSSGKFATFVFTERQILSEKKLKWAENMREKPVTFMGTTRCLGLQVLSSIYRISSTISALLDHKKRK